MSALMLSHVIVLACGLAMREPAPEAASTTVNRVDCIDPRSLDSIHSASVLRARRAARDGEWNQAADLWRDALLIDQRPAAHWLALGEVLVHAERYREAAAAYQRAIQLDARLTGVGTRGVARAYAQMGNDRQAIRWLEQALRLGARPDQLWGDEAFSRYRNEPRLRGVTRRQVGGSGGYGEGSASVTRS
jgi:tetratricopeptide (TPR) repeat protein